jgi:hypothetical protein
MPMKKWLRASKRSSMPDALLLLAALLSAELGMAWLALAMDMHWSQVRVERSRSRVSVNALRILGAASLLSSLALCLLADTATMAVPVWMMLLAASALSIAFLLSWRPRVLAPLVAWAGNRLHAA